MTEWGPLLASSFQRAPWGWGVLATAVLALIKAWPILAQQAIEARAKLRAEGRADLHECKEELKLVNARLDVMQDTFNNLKIELSSALSAYRILDAEVEATNPTSLGLKQARVILSTAFTVAPSTRHGDAEQ